MPDIIPPEDFDPRPRRVMRGTSKRNAAFAMTSAPKKRKVPWWEKYGKERVSSSDRERP